MMSALHTHHPIHLEVEDILGGHMPLSFFRDGSIEMKLKLQVTQVCTFLHLK